MKADPITEAPECISLISIEDTKCVVKCGLPKGHPLPHKKDAWIYVITWPVTPDPISGEGKCSEPIRIKGTEDAECEVKCDLPKNHDVSHRNDGKSYVIKWANQVTGK